MGQERRGIAATLVVAAMCLLIAGFAAYGAYAVVDEDAFAERALSTLHSDEVREDVGARISGRLTSNSPELSAGEDLMADAVAESVTADPAFRAGFDLAARDLHRALFDDPDAKASLQVAGSGAMLHDALEARHVGATIPPLEDVPLFTVESGGREQSLRSLAAAAGGVALPAALLFGVLGLGLLATAVVREPDHRRAVWGASLAVSAAGGLTAAIVTAAKDVVLDNYDTGFGDAVVSTLWDTYLGDLNVWALAVCATGLVVAAAAGGPRPSVAQLLAAPASRRGRALRATGLLAVAALAVQLPEMVLHTGLVALAAGLFYVAAGDLLRVVAPPSCAGRRVRAVAVAAALLGLIAVAAVPI